MSRLLPQFFFLAAMLAVVLGRAQNSPPLPLNNFSATSTNLLPPMPQMRSPVDSFRELLAMPVNERTRFLTNRPPEVRARILAKVHEYLALDPDERELRLRATELRWYLTPLFRLAPADRDARLAQAPENLRGLIQTRLAQWDILPPAMQQEFLANDRALHYFAHVETTNDATEAQQKISVQFNQFFELTPAEKTETLKTLSDSERAQMEKTLQSFEQLPPPQRMQCVRNYAKFAGMSVAERAEFLKNAARWAQMSPQERQSWRDLVAHVPLWPPLPPAAPPLPPMVPMNLMPHATPKMPRTNMATNP
jgi:hypothetical protein